MGLCCVLAGVCVRVCECVRVRVGVRVPAWVRVCVWGSVCLRARARVCMCVCPCLCACSCVRVRVCGCYDHVFTSLLLAVVRVPWEVAVTCSVSARVSRSNGDAVSLVRKPSLPLCVPSYLSNLLHLISFALASAGLLAIWGRGPRTLATHGSAPAWWPKWLWQETVLLPSHVVSLRTMLVGGSSWWRRVGGGGGACWEGGDGQGQDRGGGSGKVVNSLSPHLFHRRRLLCSSVPASQTQHPVRNRRHGSRELVR